MLVISSDLKEVELVISRHLIEDKDPISDDKSTAIFCKFRQTIGLYPPVYLQQGTVVNVTVEGEKYDVLIKQLWDSRGKTISKGVSFTGLLNWKETCV